jgi:hypothetical protein
MAQLTDVDVDSVVQSFLKAMLQKRVAVMVTYGLQDAETGKPVLRVVSNTNKAGTDGIMNWLTRIDARGIEAAARALFMAAGHAEPAEIEAKWSAATEEVRAGFRVLAQAAIGAAKAQHGQSLNVYNIQATEGTPV